MNENKKSLLPDMAIAKLIGILAYIVLWSITHTEGHILICVHTILGVLISIIIKKNR